MRSDAMTIRAATPSDTGGIGRLAASSGAVTTDPGSPVADGVSGRRRPPYQLLRQNGDAGAAGALRRHLALAA